MSSPCPAQLRGVRFFNNPKVILAFPLQVLISFFNQGKSIQLLKPSLEKSSESNHSISDPITKDKSNFNSLKLFFNPQGISKVVMSF